MFMVLNTNMCMCICYVNISGGGLVCGEFGLLFKYSMAT